MRKGFEWKENLNHAVKSRARHSGYDRVVGDSPSAHPLKPYPLIPSPLEPHPDTFCGTFIPWLIRRLPALIFRVTVYYFFDSSRPVTTSPTSLPVSSFLSLPAQTDGLQLATGLPEGCGVIASQAFKEGQTVCRVPLSAMMTLQTAIQATVSHCVRW